MSASMTTATPNFPLPPTFNWKGKSAEDADINGYIEGPTQDEAERKLKESGVRPTQLSKGKRSARKRSRKWGPAERAKFVGQIAAHRRALRAIDSALLSIARTTTNAKLREILPEIARDISLNGVPTDEAFAKYPEFFPADFCSMISIGESSGADIEVLEYYKAIQERSARAWKKIKAALRYPAAVALIATIVVAVMLIWFVPTMKGFYVSLLGPDNSELPLMTRAVVGASNFIAGFGGLLTGGALFLTFRYVRTVLRTENGKLLWQSLQLKLPVAGPLLRRYHAARACHAVSLLHKAGRPLPDIFARAANAATNIEYYRILRHIHHQIIEGASLVTACQPFMRHLGYDILNVCDSSEADGSIERHFREQADSLDATLDEELDAMSAWIEPAAILFLGVIVGGILVALYSPLLTLAGRLATGGK
jgi:type IV pilus assembly protein PilC